MIQKFKAFLSIFAVYMSFCGLAGFSLFIIEEASQQVVFSSWMSADSQDWETMNVSATLIEEFTKTMRVVNTLAGWFNPLTYISYSAYAKASDQDVKAMRAKILAHAPHLFVGKTVEVTLTRPVWNILPDGNWSTNTGQITVVSPTQLPANSRINGVLDSTLKISLPF